MERPPLGGEGYQRDGASSRFTHLIIFTKVWFYTLFKVDYFGIMKLNMILYFL
jgi:hypothetical protein